ncbi:hypothetical protein [Candidatus Mycolicibacterium alkanivorans]|uniref:Integral membrane protein n=1 Tax=Candidatus Mycolicibacterium alkanivorans TaxID=2954114 RepID=A0ABS9YTB3_9MYCO|nr:hypothetical protein [Candidatus Mycolicibacterium alkanivorans]MCI4674458.1 hypothetical protein [Candidatus Mycolicibacterium alkanivorans]
MTPGEHADAVAKVAIYAAACGILSTVPVWPPLQALLLLVFLLTGPGSALMCWAALPPAVTVAAVVGLSVSSVLATAVAMAWVPFWGPVPSCLVLSAAVITSGLVRLRALRKPVTESATPW